MAKGKIRNLFTDEEVRFTKEKHTRKDGTIDYIKMSKVLSNNRHGTTVSPELCLYWAKQFDEVKKNGESYATLSKANKAIKDNRVLRKPSLQDDDAQIDLNLGSNSSILVIPDQHAPYQHPDTIPFLIEVAAKYKPDLVVNLGDETDMHGLSYHDSDPDLDSAGVELAKARVFLGQLASVFPKMLLCHSNHGSMLHRKAKTHGIPADMLKSYRDMLFPNGGGEGWDWKGSHRIPLPNGDFVQFQHQASGNLLDAAAHERCNLVIGHFHSKFSIEYSASRAAAYWAMFGGCLVDAKSLAFAYGNLFKNKPIVGCSVILDSLPLLIPMRLDSEGRWIGKL